MSVALFEFVRPAGRTYSRVRLRLSSTEVKSLTGPTEGTVSWTARVSTVRFEPEAHPSYGGENLKEAAGKTLA